MYSIELIIKKQLKDSQEITYAVRIYGKTLKEVQSRIPKEIQKVQNFFNK